MAVNSVPIIEERASPTEGSATTQIIVSKDIESRAQPLIKSYSKLYGTKPERTE